MLLRDIYIYIYFKVKLADNEGIPERPLFPIIRYFFCNFLRDPGRSFPDVSLPSRWHVRQQLEKGQSCGDAFAFPFSFIGKIKIKAKIKLNGIFVRFED